MPKYSIIIPTLNEAEYLPKVLRHLQKIENDFDIIVSDGGSNDDTIKIAKKFSVGICESNRGKGIQMNAGAGCSSGEILIFLHADTFLPKNAFALLNDVFANRKTDLLLFRTKFAGDNFLMKIFSWFTKFDSIFTSFGDQVIVMRRSYFSKIGGFPQLPIFEDVELLRIVRKTKKITKLAGVAITSARRFEKYGVIKAQLKNAFYIMEYLLGVSPEVIYKKYYGENV